MNINNLTFKQIGYDSDNLLYLLNNFKNINIESLYLIPFISLFCVESNNFLNKNGIEIKLNQDSIFNENSIRTKLKCFENDYIKSKKIIDNCNFIQDYLFRKKVKSVICKNNNLYYNIGLYFINNIIIGNTQYAYYIFQDSKLLKKSISELDNSEFELTPNEYYNYGIRCGETISQIHSLYTIKQNYFSISDYIIYYKDYNTKKLFNNTNELSINLYLIHILSNINYILYILKKYEQNDKGLWMKIYYITYYYSIFNLKKLKEYFIKNKLNNDSINELFILVSNVDKEMNTDFRSFLMHYEFKNIKTNTILINSDFYDENKKIFGLVESLFGGTSYEELKEKILDNLFKISNEINNVLNIDISNLKVL